MLPISLLHCLPPEMAHDLGLFALSHGLLPDAPAFSESSLQVEAFGLHFPHPLGLAAGFDKNAVAIDGLLSQGFAFVEAGTVTPKPQSGNSKPRIFRLREDEAVINRLGFNNDGLDAFTTHFSMHKKQCGIAGANIGKNKHTQETESDYARGLMAVYPYADYITVNVSSPNTPGLRDLQQSAALQSLLAVLLETREAMIRECNKRVPLLLKIAPDLSDSEKADIVAALVLYPVDGLIVGNTTVSRPVSIKSRTRGEQGGLSGKPLMPLSTQCLKDFYRLTGGKLPLIGVGGIASAEDAYAKIRAGATLLQLYTALVYQGFGVVQKIHNGLSALLKRDGFTHITQAIGVDANTRS